VCINKTKSCFFEETNRKKQPMARLIKIKDQEKRKQKQNDKGGKAPFLAAL